MHKSFVAALFSGLIFGIGLAVSGMTKPQKVIGFLDIQNWDPTLIFVMMGAIGVHAIAYRLVKRRESPFFESKFQIPNRSDIDKKLIIGSALFGVGWAFGGICPGPSLVSLPAHSPTILIFVPMMLVGMFAHHMVSKFLEAKGTTGG